MITYDYYRIFYYVAQYKSFTKAARALHNNQPNITRCMNNLEQELKYTLFLRSNKGIALTPEGRQLYEHVALAFEQLSIGEEEIRQNGELEHGLVSIGASENALRLILLEKLELFRRAKAYVGDSCLIIAGTGSNCTEHAAALSRAAEGAGADALLVVTPYYNKATPEGLLAHYSAVAGAVHIPVIAYNVPSRTGVDIPVEVYDRLSRIPNLAGVKEASSGISKIAKLCAACPDFPVWSGNDDQAVAVMSLGGQGVISVLSNVAPVETQAMAQAALAGDFDTAAALQAELLPLIELLFCEVNPIPVKAAMQLIGYDCGGCRLPLTPMSEENLEKLKKYLL